MSVAKAAAKAPAAAAPKKAAKPAPAPVVSSAVDHLAFQLNGAPASASATPEEQDANRAAADAVTTASPYGVIIEDGLPAAEGQINRTAFMDRMEPAIERTADEQLKPAGRQAKDCPYLGFWVNFYREQSAAHIERAIAKYVKPEQTDLASIEAAILAQVRVAVAAWVDHREVQVPGEIDWRKKDDRVADAPGEGAVAQRMRSDGYGAPAAPGSAAAIRSQLSGGRPLDAAVRTRMERGFGTSFKDVRLHTDGHAARLADDYSARAFTVGQDVAFGRGQYRPGTLAGDALIAHELTHTLQQRGATEEASQGGDASLEVDANTAAFRALTTIARAPLSPAPAWALQRDPAFNAAVDHAQAHAAIFSPAGGLRLQRCGIFSEPEQRFAGPRTIPVATTVAPAYAGANHPAEHPQVNLLHGGGWETVIDADGDQSKELTVRIFQTGRDRLGKVTGFRLELQPAWAAAAQSTNYDLTGVWSQMFVPRVEIVTDGRAPTEFSLFEVESLHQLLIDPAEIAPDGSRSYLTRLSLSSTGLGPVGTARQGQQHRFAFSGGPSQTFDIFEVAAPARLADVWVLDTHVGPFRDPFRLSFGKPDPSRPDAILGISGLAADGPIGGSRTDFRVAGPLNNVRVLSSSGAALVLDLNGDGQADLRLYDRMSSDKFQTKRAGQERLHLFTMTSTPSSVEMNAGYFPVHEGKMEVGATAGAETNFPAASQARAVGGAIEQQKRVPDRASELRLVEVTQAVLRHNAVQANLISQRTYDTWAAFSADLAVIDEVGPSAVTQVFRQRAATDARAFFAAFDADAREENTTEYRPGGKVLKNKYTGLSQFFTGTITPSTPGDLLAGAITDGRWDSVKKQYRELVEGLDRWIADRARGRTDIKEPVGQLPQLSGLRRELAELESHNPTRVSAVFHAQGQFVEGGSITEIPLSLYYWRDGNKWRIRDITNPEDVFNKDRTFVAGETEPPASLFSRLEEGSHFPRGWIYYRLPSGTEGRVETTGPSAVREALTWAGTALAVAGFILATGGTGTVAVIGGWALAAGAVIGAGLAATDLYERVRDGNLNAAPVILDIAQIVASATGLSAARFGKLVVAARTAAVEGAPLVGTAARMATWADRLLVPVVAANVAADVVTLGVVAEQIAQQYDALDDTIADPDTRRRAKAALLSQAALTGFFTVLSLRGNVPSLSRGKTLQLEYARGAKGELIPVAWPVLRITDPEVTALFADRRFQDLFSAEPTLRAQLEANVPLLEVLVTRASIRDVVLEYPEVLKSLVKHPEAIPIVRRALNAVAAQHPVSNQPTTPGGIKLNTSQQATKASLNRSTDPAGATQPGWHPPGGKADEAYIAKYLKELYRDSEIAQKELERFANALASRTKGTPEFRTEPKKEYRSQQKIQNDYDNDASKLTDLAAGSITYENVDELFRALDELEKSLQGSTIRLARFNDRISTPEAESGYSDIQMNLRMSNGHVAEFRFHLKKVEAFAKTEHALYEVRRSYKPLAAKLGRPLTAEETAVRLTLEDLAREGFIQALQQSATPTP